MGQIRMENLIQNIHGDILEPIIKIFSFQPKQNITKSIVWNG